jgi:carbon-monoxide dehydrogenase large subunit
VKFGIGQAVRRQEDDPLLRGQGRYVADHAPVGALHAAVVRSPHAHAGFRLGDLAAVRAMPGVRLLLTAADTADLGSLPCLGALPGQPLVVPDYPILARDEVRHVGDAVAFVAAETGAQARDAADALAIEWEALPQVTGAEAAVQDGAPRVWAQRPGNIAFETTLGESAPTAAAFARAAGVVTLRLVNQRVVTNYLDTRAVVAEYDAATDRITLTLGSQGSHFLRDMLTETILKIPPEKMRVITPDVGGGFGTKFFPYREYALAAVAAKQSGRPVKWVAERSEHFLADAHGRDNVTVAKLALDRRGRFLALEVDTLADMGAYLSCYAPFIPFIGAEMLPGVYDIPACHIRLRGVYTNTVPVDAYRGAGRPEASYVIERLVDAAAHELKIAPDELRRRNFIPPRAMPYRTATGKVYDSGEFAAHMARAKEIGDWDGFGARAKAAKKSAKLRGIGLATYIEACGSGGPETAKLRLDGDGIVTVLIGSQSTGQGHRTAYAQLVAEHLGLDPAQVRVIQGDTDLIATGAGTGGSTSIPIGGVSVAVAARTLAGNLKTLAADILEASAADLEIADGAVRVIGTDRIVTLAELARRPQTPPDLLQAEHEFGSDVATYPNGTHLAEVEIDAATGATTIVSYIVVDDFGVTLNPLLLEGQVHGGAVQGIGQALMENTVYDAASGQLLSASLMDYALPRALDAPAFTFETHNVRCATNPLGVKGAGEAGAIGSCPAVLNAVADALWRAGRTGHVDMPATPERVWTALQADKSL